MCEITGGFTEHCIDCPSFAFSYVNICFSLLLQKQVCLFWALNVLKPHTFFWKQCMRARSFGQALQYWKLQMYSEGKVHIYIWLCVTYILLFYVDNTARYCYCSWHHLFQKCAVLQPETHGSLKCLLLKYSSHCICFIIMLHNNSVNSFTSGDPGADSTSSTLLRKVWMEENGHHGIVASCAHGWALYLCVNWFCKCNVCVCFLCVEPCSKTCVRLLAVLLEMVLLGSPFRKPNIGMDSVSWELWTSSCWLLTTAELSSMALWGDNTWGIKWGLSGGRFRRSMVFQYTQDV